MERSTRPTDVLELGRYLVNENLGERNNDTLARWLLHAIAERLAACDAAPSSAQKRKRESEAADLILRLWKHRAAAPMGIDPLAPYERVFKALRSLLPQANPWLIHERSGNETVAAELYRCLSLLSASMFLLSLDAIPKRSGQEKSLHASFLPPSENSILLLFEQVTEFLYPSLKPDLEGASQDTPKASSLDVAQSMRALIEKTRSALNEALAIVNKVEKSASSQKMADAVVATKVSTNRKSAKGLLSKSKITKLRSPKEGSTPKQKT